MTDTRPALHVHLGREVEDSIARLLAPVLRVDRLSRARFIPSLPRAWRRIRGRVWPEIRSWSTPPELLTVPGVWRDAAAEARAFAADPLHDYSVIHAEPISYFLAHGWRFMLPTAPRMVRAARRMQRLGDRHPRMAPVMNDSARLTRRIRDEAARLGISAIGFAPFDEKYSFAEHAEKHVHPTVIAVVLEQAFAATQSAPSVHAERAAFRAYSDLASKMTALAKFIQRFGYEARGQDAGGETAYIHYCVQAGLGQLGLNGQLLTPYAGSRARLAIITTNAPVEFDGPIDFGIHTICDACQLCVRRCPVGAIPLKRHEHRGVTKAKVKTERCLPVMAQAHGCAICMKVCPIQRYGLSAVTDHYIATNGEILGKGSDTLEGFDWPLDGQHYGPGEKPRVTSALLQPPGWSWSEQLRTYRLESSSAGAESSGDSGPPLTHRLE